MMNPEHLNGKKIVLFRTDRLGDLILAFPAVEAIKRLAPESEIHIFTARSNTPLAEMQKNVSRVIPNIYSGPRGLLELVGFLKTEEYHAAVHLYPRPGLALATFLSRIPVRIGSAYRYYSFLFNKRQKIHRKQMVVHERDLNLKILETMGIPSSDVSAGLTVPREALRDTGVLLSASGLAPASSFVVLHPGSGGSSLNWPVEHYGTLGRELVAKGWPVVLTGTERESSTVQQVRNRMGEGALDLCGKLDLERLAALLSMASLTVSNSTGPLHLADALGGKVIGLYSPHFYSSPKRWGPYEQMENVFLPPDKACLRCPKDRCMEFNCMETITPETVLAKAVKLLSS